MNHRHNKLLYLEKQTLVTATSDVTQRLYRLAVLLTLGTSRAYAITLDFDSHFKIRMHGSRRKNNQDYAKAELIRCIDPTGAKRKPLRKQRSTPQVSEVFCSVSIDL